jgi:signal transduction histidine kinase
MAKETPLERLIDISRQLAENRALDPLLEYAMDVALELFGAERGYLVLLSQDGALDFRVRRNRYGRHIDRPEEQISQTILNEVILNHKDLITTDAVVDPALSASDSVRSLQLRSVMCVPLIARGTTLGAIYVENRTATGIFRSEALKPLKLFASQAAVSIANAMLNEELEERVAARTLELENANERLEQLVAELDAYASTVAHDLKDPLGLVITGSEFLVENYAFLSENALETALVAILRGARRMHNIIESILLLAGVRGRRQVAVGLLDMGSVVGFALERLTLMIESYGAEIIVPDSWPAALGYGPWVEEIWANYVSNALKYGGQPPRVELGATAEADGMVRFWVQDNGPGIAHDDQDRLFTPYTQLDETTVRGHGLGLSIVQRIVERLSGTVGVESQTGRGSVFSFTLPGIRGRTQTQI